MGFVGLREEKRRGLSIKIVAALYSVIAVCVLTAVVAYSGYHLFQKKVMENYQKYTVTVLENAYTIVEDYRFGDMIANREMPHGYEQMRERLNKIKETSDIEYLYAIYFEDIDDIHSLTYAINTKTTDELAHGGSYTYLGTPCEAGSFEDETIINLQQAVRNGQKKSAVLDGESEEYGHMLNGYKVIFDSEGNPVGLLCVEIDVNDIKDEVIHYVRTIVIFATIFTIVVTGLYIYKFENSIILPITGITDSANDFIRKIGDQEAMDKSAQKLAQKDIKYDNEVGDLYRSVSKMETDMAKQLRDIRAYNEYILKMQNGLMVLMADMVEIRDQDTGAHIQKTASYVQIILDGLRLKGYYSDILTPQYIDDVIKSAPLHDIGKINIPDSILNKKSKLTDEEYEIMKTHTTAGKDIIDKAIRDVEAEGENYLQEARNMAAYHHERWDGKGYPEGLSGEDIPLSARVMAVADVFDALTSPRVYKPAFPLPEAVEMIKKGAGVQFDPKCVEVLIDSLPKVEAVLRRLNPGYIGDGN